MCYRFNKEMCILKYTINTMKIKLVNCVFEEKRIFEPMGICYIASCLREEGFFVDILDPRIRNYTIDQTVDFLMKDSFEILGLSVMSFYKSNINELTRKLREKGFNGKIVLGGISPTICTDLYLSKCPDIDMVMCGDGENIWVELAKSIEKTIFNPKYSEEWKKILGIAYKDRSGKVVFNKGRIRIENLDELPFMARDILEENIAVYGKDKMFVPILSSRGCYGRCSYCWISAALDTQEGLRYRQRSMYSVVDEIEFLNKKYEITQFSFEDDNFIVPGAIGIERAKEFRDLLKARELKIEFSFQTRPETVTKEVIGIYKEAGLVKPYIGIESIEDDLVSLDKKNVAITYATHIENILNIFSDMGYEPDIGRENYMELKFGYITFHPQTTVNSFKNAVNFFKKHHLTPKRLVKKMNLIDGDMDVKQVFRDNQYTSDKTTDYEFKDERVKLIYIYMRQYAEEVFEVRDQIRSIEKHLFFIKVDKDKIKMLVDCRKKCDEFIYDFGINVVKIVEENDKNIDVINDNLSVLTKEMIYKFKKYVERNNIMQRIKSAYKKYGVKREMFDLYW